MKKWLTLPLRPGAWFSWPCPRWPMEGHMNRPSDLSTIPVNGSYQEKLETETVYSVDISWGSMEFVYAKEGTGVWNPETHSYDNVSGAGWQYPAGGAGGWRAMRFKLPTTPTRRLSVPWTLPRRRHSRRSSEPLTGRRFPFPARRGKPWTTRR